MALQQSTAVIRLAGDIQPRLHVNQARTTDATIGLTLPNALVYFECPESVRQLDKTWGNATTPRLPQRFPVPVVQEGRGGRLTHMVSLDDRAVVDVSYERMGHSAYTMLRLQLGALSIDVMDQEAMQAMSTVIDELVYAADQSFIPEVDLVAARTGMQSMAVNESGFARQLRME